MIKKYNAINVWMVKSILDIDATKRRMVRMFGKKKIGKILRNYKAESVTDMEDNDG